MQRYGVGGGNTITGLNFEREVDFLTLIQKIPNYRVKNSEMAGSEIFYRNKIVARCFGNINFISI